MTMKLLMIFGLSTLFTSCLTTDREKRTQTDIFNIQTRLLQIEQKLNDEKKSTEVEGDSNKQKIAALSADVEKMHQDINKAHGDIDALKVGITTGQMPGMAEEPKEGSIAASIKEMRERLDALEASHAELLNLIKKSGVKTGQNSKANDTKDKDKDKDLGLKELKSLFAKKQYKEVSEQVEKHLKKTKGKDKMEFMYLQSESLYKMGNLRESALKFNDLTESFPDSKYVPYAKLRIGDCFRHLNDTVTAKIYYNELVAKFQDTEEGKKAKERLAELDKKQH